ncbi:hypothetical protein BG000_004894 [Podila horticola]|nr:hypothetical protein BG000_004894 [Podila horticola]
MAFLQALFSRTFTSLSTLDTPQVQPSSTHRLPAEWEPHERTFIVWPTNNVTDTIVDAVRQEIILLAKAIAKYEPVVVIARPDLVDSAQSALGPATNIQVIALAIDGFWTRDTAPVFLTSEPHGELAGVDFNFTGWYQRHQLQGIPKLAQTLLEKYAVPRTKAAVVAEGGAFETDGLGTLLVTQRSLVNKHRNPNLSRDEIEQELVRTLGVRKVIWLTPDEDTPTMVMHGPSDRHEDPQVRFLAPGVVALSHPHGTFSREYKQAAEILAAALDSRGLPFTIVDIEEHSKVSDTDWAADKLVLRVLAEQFPGREVVPMRMDAVVSAGGGIHLATRNQPRCEGPEASLSQ